MSVYKKQCFQITNCSQMGSEPTALNELSFFQLGDKAGYIQPSFILLVSRISLNDRCLGSVQFKCRWKLCLKNI